MGNESSQPEPPQASQLQAARRDDDAASNGTSGSRALARDLIRSIEKDTQDDAPAQPPKKRKRRKSVDNTESLLPASKRSPDVSGDGTACGASLDHVHSSNDEALPSLRPVSDQPEIDGRIVSRRRLKKKVRRMEKTVLVSSGQAKWVPSINGAKWNVERQEPDQTSKHALTSEEEHTLALCEGRLKEARQKLADFDRDTAQIVAERPTERAKPKLKPQIAAANGAIPTESVGEGVIEQAMAMEEPLNDLQRRPSAREQRKQEKKARRRSSMSFEAEAPVELAEVRTQSQPDLEPATKGSGKSRKKRKRQQAQEAAANLLQQVGGGKKVPHVGGKHATEKVSSWLNTSEPPETVAEDLQEGSHELLESPPKRRRVTKPPPGNEHASQLASPNSNDDELPADRAISARPNKRGLKKSKGSKVLAENSQEDTPEAPKASRKRTRISKHQEDDEDDYRPEPKSIKGLNKRASGGDSHPGSSLRDTEDNRASSTSTGPFTAEEKAIADRIFAETLQREGIGEADLKAKIITWRDAGIFKVEMEAALPNRQKPSIRKFCQRRYHAHERGPWTAEQDEALRDAYAQNPDKWTVICNSVDRSAGDCKDRWTQHLQYSHATGPWPQDEEDLLVAAVDKAVNRIKNDKTVNPDLAADRSRLEEALSWKHIAQELGNKRNHKQCREKWEKLKLRKRREDSRLNRDDSPDRKPPAMRKLKAARSLARKLEIGDFYDIFVEIHTSFDDLSKRYHNEDNVLWATVSTKNPASRFGLSDVPLRRAALEHALQEWNIDSEKVRRRLEKSEFLPAKAKVLARLLEKSYAGRLHAMSRTFLPDMIGKSKEEISDIKEKRRKAWREKRKAKVVMSNELVNDTDEDDIVDGDSSMPAIDDEDQSGSDGNDREQSAYQRRIDAQLNGREEDVEGCVGGLTEVSDLQSVEEDDDKLNSHDRSERNVESGPAVEAEEEQNYKRNLHDAYDDDELATSGENGGDGEEEPFKKEKSADEKDDLQEIPEYTWHRR